MTIPTRIQEIRERLSKATPGPWEFNVSSTTTARIWQPVLDEGLYLRRDNCKDLSPDTRLIANAPFDLQYLLNLLAERDRQVGVMRAALESSIKTLRYVQEEYCHGHGVSLVSETVLTADRALAEVEGEK